MNTENYYIRKLSYPDFESIKNNPSPLTNKGVVHLMQKYADLQCRKQRIIIANKLLKMEDQKIALSALPPNNEE